MSGLKACGNCKNFEDDAWWPKTPDCPRKGDTPVRNDDYPCAYWAERPEAELERVKLKLIFVEEWFDNLYPPDYDLCMKRWAERSTP